MKENTDSRKIFAIADLHLSLASPKKDMALLSSDWDHYIQRLETAWDQVVSEQDIVLVPGDISWAMKTHEATADLEWIEARPGRKLLSAGNHDYWWPSSSKKAKELGFSSITIMDKELVEPAEDFLVVAVKGAEDPSLNFSDHVAWTGSAPKTVCEEEKNTLKKRLDKELQRLERRLELLQQRDPERKKQWIVMIHYPPTDPSRSSTSMMRLLEKYRVDLVVFGHLHSLKKDFVGYDFEKGKAYFTGEKPVLHFTAADWLDFCPKQIVPIEKSL